MAGSLKGLSDESIFFSGEYFGPWVGSGLVEGGSGGVNLVSENDSQIFNPKAAMEKQKLETVRHQKSLFYVQEG